MTIRPSRRRATATERGRVTKFSQADNAQTAAYSQIGPRNIPEVKIWLRVDLATDSGTLTIPDAMGGASATQATAARKPVLGTTSNGLAKLTCTDDCLVLPISAGFNNAAWFGIAMWIRPANVTTSSDIFNVTTAAGASINKLSFRQTTDDLVDFLWAADGSANRSGRTLTGKAVLAANVWVFVSMEFDGSQTLESDKNRFKLNGTPVPAPNAVAYSDGVPTVGAPGPSVLNTPTGNALLFARTTVPANPFIGDVGPDIFFYDPRTITAQSLVQLAQFRVPVG